MLVFSLPGVVNVLLGHFFAPCFLLSWVLVKLHVSLAFCFVHRLSPHRGRFVCLRVRIRSHVRIPRNTVQPSGASSCRNRAITHWFVMLVNFGMSISMAHRSPDSQIVGMPSVAAF